MKQVEFEFECDSITSTNSPMGPGEWCAKLKVVVDYVNKADGIRIEEVKITNVDDGDLVNPEELSPNDRLKLSNKIDFYIDKQEEEPREKTDDYYFDFARDMARFQGEKL